MKIRKKLEVSHSYVFLPIMRKAILLLSDFEIN